MVFMTVVNGLTLRPTEMWYELESTTDVVFDVFDSSSVYLRALHSTTNRTNSTGGKPTMLELAQIRLPEF